MGASAALVVELGDHYEFYHAFLAQKLTSRTQPGPPNTPSELDGYLRAWSAIQAILRAEGVLRFARRVREGSPSDATLALPFVDSQQRLVSAVTGVATVA